MNYWAIITGINQYQNLQPLMYAQQDALSLWHFLVDDAAFEANHGALLSDIVTSDEAGTRTLSAYGKTWRDRIVQLCQQQVQPDDLLWVFFSGYGAQFEGQDYLMPIDGDPNQIPDTALAVQWLYQQLKLAPTDNIVVALDINRSQGALADQQIGSQIIELAKDFGIATLLSCQPTEFTHETVAVGHGLFTQALLEGMQHHGCVTLGQISDYLSDRLPELCEHHWRPIQHPVALIPRDKQFLMLMSPEAVTHLPLTEAAAAAMAVPDPEPVSSSPSYFSSDDLPEQISDHRQPESPVPAPPISAQSVLTQSVATQPDPPQDTYPQPIGATAASAEATLTPDVPVSPSANPTADVPIPEPPEADEPLEADEPFSDFGGFRWVLSVAIFAVVGALVGQLIGLPTLISNFFNGSSETAVSNGEPIPQQNPEQRSEADPETESSADVANSETEQPTADDTSGLAESTAADASENGLASNTLESMRPTPTNLNGDANAVVEAASSSHPLFARAIVPIDPAGAPSELAMAQAAIADQRFSDALIWLTQVPFGQQTTDYQALYEQVERDLYDQSQRNQAVLAEAQVQAEANQVDSLNRAIFQAQQIRPGEALYREAQATIYTWSQQILALAQAAADAENLGAAIAMADFVPRSQPAVHATAQAAALQWQGRLAYRQIIEQAQILPQPGQAVSFHKAIVQIRDIPPGTPESGVAQQLTQQWSEEILTIARARAAQGRLQDAIAAAQMIPTDTTVYATAQQLIDQWQRQ
ncbi:MAG: caspase family protein [Cyanobacteria bacterium J06639_16]